MVAGEEGEVPVERPTQVTSTEETHHSKGLKFIRSIPETRNSGVEADLAPEKIDTHLSSLRSLPALAPTQPSSSCSNSSLPGDKAIARDTTSITITREEEEEVIRAANTQLWMDMESKVGGDLTWSWLRMTSWKATRSF